MINIKDDFSTILNYTYPMMSGCERFGSVSGCHGNCPIFSAGECEIQEENEKLFNEE